MVEAATTLWPLAPNWRQPYNVTYEFRTDINTSRSGREQRRAQRSTARKVLKFTVTRGAKSASAFRRLIYGNQGTPLDALDLSRSARLAASIVAGQGSFRLGCDLPPWIAPDAEIAFAPRGAAYIRARVASVTPDGAVNLVDPVAVRVDRTTPLHPVVRGRIDDTVSVRDYSAAALEAEVSFLLDPAVNIADVEGEPDEVFNRREVFVAAPNEAAPIAGEFRRSVDDVDFGRGRTKVFLLIGFSSRTKQFQLLARTEAERQRIVALFLRMKGQRGEFYAPSFEDDFHVVPHEASQTSATFAGTDLCDTFEADDIHRAVVIRMADGNRFYRRIVAASTDGTTSTLITDVPWPCDIDANVEVRWLIVHRFAVDQIALDCITDAVGQVQFSVVSLEDLPVGDLDSALFSSLDGAGQWALEHWGKIFFEKMADRFDLLVNKNYPFVVNTIGFRSLHFADSHFTTLNHRYAIATVGGVTYA